jgi:hypothetical protein
VGRWGKARYLCTIVVSWYRSDEMCTYVGVAAYGHRQMWYAG